MKKIRANFPVAIVTATLLCAVPLTHSAEGEVEPEMNCDKNQMTANICARRSYKESDKQLNDSYKELMGNLKKVEDKQRIRSEQRDWIKARDRQCDPILRMQGSIRPMQYWRCMREVTDMRIQVLDIHLSCPSGTCPR